MQAYGKKTTFNCLISQRIILLLINYKMNINQTKLVFTAIFALSITLGIAQAPENWFNLDYTTDGVRGVSTEKLYETLAKGKKTETVIVAVIDSGVDAEHEDLKDVMWVNKDEIPGNGIDDDKNGYVDDIHGWNFLGGKDGRNVNDETLEVTRLYAHHRKKYGDLEDVSKLSKKEKKEYELFKKVKKEVEDERNKAQAQLANFEMTETMYMNGLKTARELLGSQKLTAELIEELGDGEEDPTKTIAIRLLGGALEDGRTLDEIEEEIKGQIEGAKEYFAGQANYFYNPDWNPRKDIIKDDYSNSYEKGYGNNDVKGPDAGHGTHVAGIIGAVRDNGIGMKGVANDVRIMSVRAVPNGDEHDKDVANAILYAVNNGATVINMSFGKSYSWDKPAVNAAVKHACKKDVLLVHAAGNSNQDNDTSSNFPNDKIKKKKTAPNWLEIGALSWKKGDEAPARFSNYGAANVDLFAPGVDIYSTVPDIDAYDSFSGTSMASPVTAGVAAMLRSYFPALTAVQVKEILMKSIVPISGEVKLPGSEDKVKMKDLCITGGVLSATKAFELASKTKGKKKVKKSPRA